LRDSKQTEREREREKVERHIKLKGRQQAERHSKLRDSKLKVN
jgi:hypothetical protein